MSIWERRCSPLRARLAQPWAITTPRAKRMELMNANFELATLNLKLPRTQLGDSTAQPPVPIAQLFIPNTNQALMFSAFDLNAPAVTLGRAKVYKFRPQKRDFEVERSPPDPHSAICNPYATLRSDLRQHLIAVLPVGCGLADDHVVIGSAGCHQLIVGAALDDQAVLHKQDQIGPADRGKTVGDHERRATGQQVGHRGLNELLALGVQVA